MKSTIITMIGATLLLGSGVFLVYTDPGGWGGFLIIVSVFALDRVSL